jgi:hypothetical protein
MDIGFPAPGCKRAAGATCQGKTPTRDEEKKTRASKTNPWMLKKSLTAMRMREEAKWIRRGLRPLRLCRVCRAERLDASRPSLLMISCKLRRCWTPLISLTSLYMLMILQAVSPPNSSIKRQMSTFRTRTTKPRSSIDGIGLEGA